MEMGRKSSLVLRALILPVLALPGAARADLIQPGFYQLHNHPDGTEVPPPYGMRLDELVDVTGGHDVFTFDFDHAGSDMKLIYNSVASTITISGMAYGGRDAGGDYVNDVYLGLYAINFVYNVGVLPVPGDDDLYVVAPSGSNFGTIDGPGAVPAFALSDKSGGDYTFRFGDENDDNGHRGFNPGISGWGWMMVDGRYNPAMDWIFTAEYIRIPEPASAIALGLGALLVAVRRRK